MINDLAVIFGSKTKAQEIVLLLFDAKVVVRQGFYPQELPVVEAFCKEKKLFMARSKFKVALTDQGKYSNKGMKLSSDDPTHGMYFVYISKNEEKAWLAAYYEQRENHRDLGLLLGYPSCCVDFFCRNFSGSTPDLARKSLNRYTNLSHREDDCVLLSHFPCSPDCAESITLGKLFLSVLLEIDPVRAKEMQRQLGP